MGNFYLLIANVSLLSHILVFLPFLCLMWSLIINYNKRSHYNRLVSLPPGPSSLSIIGDLYRLGTFPHQSMQKMLEKYGDIFYLKLGQVPIVVISSRDLAKIVTKTQDLDFCSRPPRKAFKKFTYDFLDVAFSPYGDSWKHLRKLYITELLSGKKVQMSRSNREEMVGTIIHQIGDHASIKPEESINLSSMIVALVQDVICSIVLGKSWITYDAKKRETIMAAFEEQSALLGYFCLADFFPWARWFDVLSGYNQRLEKTFTSLDNYIEEVVQQRVEYQTLKEEHEEDFVDLLLRLEKSSSLTRDHVKANLSIVFLAAIDNNFSTIIWAMSELMQNKRVMDTAQEEVRRVCGSKGKVEECDSEKLPYLRTVVKETLRLHLPTPFLIPRESIRQTTIEGYDIPEKSLILINAYSISRDPRYWQDPTSFIPERFLGSDIDYNGQHFEYLPFGAGRRSCPGIQYAAAIVELTLANLLYAFNWELPPTMANDGVDMSEKTGLSVKKKFPLFVIPKIVAPI